MYSMSAPIFTRTLTSLLAILDKAEAHAKEKGFDANNYVGLRLTADMFAFARQIQIASDAAKGCIARLADVETPSWPDEEATVDELRERLQKTIDFIASVPAEKIDGSEEREILLPIGPDKTMSFDGLTYLSGVALPNFFFHATMTYALLRQSGVAVGKMDFLGAP